MTTYSAVATTGSTAGPDAVRGRWHATSTCSTTRRPPRPRGSVHVIAAGVPGRRAGRLQRSRARLRSRPAGRHGRAGRRRHRAALARQVGVSARHLRRLFLQHLGATPDQLARSRRRTSPPAARRHRPHRAGHRLRLGVRQPAAGPPPMREVFALTDRPAGTPAPRGPAHGRRRAGAATAALPGYRWDAMCAFLAARRVPGVEAVSGSTYQRTITVAGAPGLLEVSPGDQDLLLLRDTCLTGKA